MKNSIIRGLRRARVAQIRADLQLEALAGALQRRDELQRVGRVDVVVGRAVVDHQPALEVLRVGHRAAGVVARLVLLRNPHVALGVDRVVEARSPSPATTAQAAWKTSGWRSMAHDRRVAAVATRRRCRRARCPHRAAPAAT